MGLKSLGFRELYGRDPRGTDLVDEATISGFEHSGGPGG